MLTSIALLALVLSGALLDQYYKPVPASSTAARLSAPLIRSHAPAFGAAEATAHVVKFLDPASDSARELYPMVKGLVINHPSKARLSLRYMPATSGSVEVIRMLEAARKQGKYWESLELLLVLQPRWVVQQTVRADLALLHLEASALVDMRRLRNDMRAPEIEQVLAQDRADAHTLHITATPGLYLNGIPLGEIGKEPLLRLLEQAAGVAATTTHAASNAPAST